MQANETGKEFVTEMVEVYDTFKNPGAAAIWGMMGNTAFLS